jgi:hypothetical protein
MHVREAVGRNGFNEVVIRDMRERNSSNTIAIRELKKRSFARVVNAKDGISLRGKVRRQDAVEDAGGEQAGRKKNGWLVWVGRI